MIDLAILNINEAKLWINDHKSASRIVTDLRVGRTSETRVFLVNLEVIVDQETFLSLLPQLDYHVVTAVISLSINCLDVVSL